MRPRTVHRPGVALVAAAVLLLLCVAVLGSGSSSSSSGGGPPAFADEFPTLADVAEMARVSRLAYRFNHEPEGYCEAYDDEDDRGYRCEWYRHDKWLGTKALILTNGRRRTIVVAFAGTDDIRTSLEDADVATKEFGNNSTVTMGSDARVHAGFDDAVFTRMVWEDVESRVAALSSKFPGHAIWTTGHSLGAADAVLTASALALRGTAGRVRSVTFGCPRIGNAAWRDRFGYNSTDAELPVLRDRLSLWRVVLGWDLVPRLPDFFYYHHVGHTLQIWPRADGDGGSRYALEAYYRHYGDETMGYAGVDQAWSVRPHEFAPYAMMFHFMTKYLEAMAAIEEEGQWVDGFETIDGGTASTATAATSRMR